MNHLYIDPSHLKALLIDLDGVLVDSEPLHVEADKVAFAHFGLKVPAHEFATFTGVPGEIVFQNMVARYGQGNIIPEQMFEYKKQWFKEKIHSLQLFPEVNDFLALAKSIGLSTCLVTSSDRLYQAYIFERFGLSPFFDTVVTIEDVQRGKPNPDPYLLGAERLRLPPQNCLVIEDAPSGIAAGKAAGCLVAALATTHQRTTLQKTSPTFLFDNLKELAKYLTETN